MAESNFLEVNVLDMFDFLSTYKQELENTFSDFLPENPTYWNFYQHFDLTQGQKEALKTACEIHNFNKFYDYIESLGYYDRDKLYGELTENLYKYGLIEEGEV